MRDGIIAYCGPDDGVPDHSGAEEIDASGATIVPGLVDCHAHFTGLGGANWLARFGDPEAELLARGDEAARDLARMGVLTARDVGAPRRLNLRIRDAARDRLDAPDILAAGTWLARRDKFPPFVVFVDSGDELRAAAVAEMDAGADLVKIAVDTGRTGDEVTFTVAELEPTVKVVHERGMKIAAHAQGKGAAVAAAAGVDSIEHGFGIDEATARRMTGRTALVPTLSVLESWIGFAETYGGRFAETKAANKALQEQAFAAVRAAKRVGVRIATGSDFGGGSVRPGHLAWEVQTLVRAGLDPYEALASATWIGGELLGMKDAGTIHEGGPANLVLVHGDPLSDPAALWRVWRVYRRGSRVS
jgi:imidazolonepropionase-like amidohydrolase